MSQGPWGSGKSCPVAVQVGHGGLGHVFSWELWKSCGQGVAVRPTGCSDGVGVPLGGCTRVCPLLGRSIQGVVRLSVIWLACLVCVLLTEAGASHGSVWGAMLGHHGVTRELCWECAIGLGCCVPMGGQRAGMPALEGRVGGWSPPDVTEWGGPQQTWGVPHQTWTSEVSVREGL